MNLQNLQYIVAINDLGSISKAAKTLYVSQPYLSKILREVEKQYHLSIFTRTKHGISPTESGRLFIDMAKDLLDNAARFEKEFEDYKESNHLRISSGTYSHSMDAFLRMVNSLPDEDLRFSYRESTNLDVINDVYTQKADIGVILLSDSNYDTIQELLKARRINCKKLFYSGTWLLVGENHPLINKKGAITFDDIYQYNLVLYPTSESSPNRAMESIYSESFLNLFELNRFRQVIQVHSRAALHNVLARTNYISLGIAPATEQEQGFHIVSLPIDSSILLQKQQDKIHTFCYIYSKDTKLPKAAKLYIDFLEKQYGTDSEYLKKDAQK